MNGIFTLNQLDQLLLKLKNQAVVVVGGCFDLLHLGHIIFLQQAKRQGQALVVLLESDDRIRKLKGEGRPVHNQQTRAQILAELKSVDYVLMLPELNSDQEYDQLVEKLSPKIIATTEGDEYDFHKKRQAEKVGAKLIYVTKPIEDHSTSKIIDAIKQN